MTTTADAIAASGATMAILSLGQGYWAMAVAGAIVGLIAWFYGYEHSDPRWSRGEATSAGLQYVLFGFITFPAAIAASEVLLPKWGIDAPAVKIMVGAISAFGITEVYPAIIAAVRAVVRAIGGGRKDV